MADKLVQSSIYSDLDIATALWGPYWASTQIGVIVFLDGGGDISYARTTDAGVTWNTTEIEAGSTRSLAVWYDQETPEFVGETDLHIAWLDLADDELKYVNLEITGDTLETVRVVTTGLAVRNTPSDNRVAITKSRSGNLVIAMSTRTEADLLAFKSADEFATGATSIASPSDASSHLQADWLLLFPATTSDGDDVACIYWDRSADELSVKMYDDSENDWTETSIATGMVDDQEHRNYDGSIRHSDGALLLGAHSDHDDGGDDLKTWEILLDSIPSPTVTPKTSIFIGQAQSAQVAVFINQISNDVYVAYLKGGSWEATVDVVFHVSEDDLSTWESEQPYSESLDDHRLVSAGRTTKSLGGRYQPAFFDDDDVDIYVNLVNDLEFTGLTLVSIGGGMTPAATSLGVIGANTYPGGLTPSGILATMVDQKVAIAGAIATITGSLVAAKSLISTVTGALTPTGLAPQIIQANYGRILIPSGSWVDKLFQDLAGTVTSAGVVTSLFTKLLSGAISTITGTFSVTTFLTLAGGIVPIGVFTIFRPPLKLAGRLRARITDRDGTKRGDILP